MKKILIIEDNENNLYLMKFLLKDLEVQLIDARDGKSGVELAAIEKPDLILMDIQLPILDGYEATRQIRQMEKGTPVPIVAITSHAMVGDRDQCFACGCTHYIEKPIDPSHTLKIIKQILEEGENNENINC